MASAYTVPHGYAPLGVDCTHAFLLSSEDLNRVGGWGQNGSPHLSRQRPVPRAFKAPRADIQAIRAKEGSLVLKLDRLRVLKKRVMTG